MDRQTLSIPEAGKVLLGLKRTASYRLFNTDPPVPVLVIGGRRVVSKVQVERYLAGEPVHQAVAS